MDFRKFARLLDSGSISEILLTDHVKLRLKQRNVDPKLIEDLLLKRQKALRGIEHQGGNRFKLTYVHPESRGMDLYGLVIVVEARERKSKMRLTVITAFPQPASRRIRVSEDGEKC